MALFVRPESGRVNVRIGKVFLGINAGNYFAPVGFDLSPLLFVLSTRSLEEVLSIACSFSAVENTVFYGVSPIFL